MSFDQNGKTFDNAIYNFVIDKILDAPLYSKERKESFSLLSWFYPTSSLDLDK
jgi:hypothetical protein